MTPGLRTVLNKFTRNPLGLAAVGALVVALILLTQSSPPAMRLEEVKTRIEAAGYHCAADSIQQHINNGFLVSRTEVSRDEVCSLCKIGPMGPEWKGKVWVTLVLPDFMLHAIPDGAAALQQGNFILFGDGDLVEELENQL